MTWTRLDDRFDEETAFLSHEAFRLYTAAIVYSRRNGRGGRLHMERDIKPLAAKLRIRRLGRALAELTAETDDDEPLCVVADAYLALRSYAKFNPPTSAERTRAYRAASRSQDQNGSNVTSHERDGDVTVTSQQRHSDAPTRARRRAGSPNPVPVPVNAVSTPNGSETSQPELSDIVWDAVTAPTAEVVSIVTISRSMADDRNPSVDLVGAYVDACRAAGASVVSPSMRGRVGKAAKALRDEGVADDVLVMALVELARRNESPARLPYIVGDVERVRAGTPLGRIIAAPIRENPVDARIRAIRERKTS